MFGSMSSWQFELYIITLAIIYALRNSDWELPTILESEGNPEIRKIHGEVQAVSSATMLI